MSHDEGKVTLIAEGATGSTLTHLDGALSHVAYPADELATIDPLDSRPLLARYDLERAARTLSDRQRDLRMPIRGVWRWHEVLPVREWSNVVTLGEGSTCWVPIMVGR